MKQKKHRSHKKRKYIPPVPKKKNPVMRISIIALAAVVLLGAILMPLAQVLS